MKTIDFLKTALIRAGIEFEPTDLNADLPEGSEEKIKSLMNTQLAKSDKAIKAHYFQLFAKQTEEKIDKIVSDSGVELNLLDENGKRKPVNEQIELVLTTLEAKAKTTDKTANEKEIEFQNRIAELSKSLNDSKLNHDNEKKQLIESYSHKAIQQQIELSLSGLNYKSEIPEEDRIALAKLRLDRHLADIKAKIKEDNGKLKLVQIDNPELEYYDSNGQKIDYSEVVKTATTSLIQVGTQTQRTSSTNYVPPQKVDTDALKDAVKNAMLKK
jgi:hypothetical protein